MENEKREFGPIFKGIVKRSDNPTLRPSNMSEFENEKTNYVAPVIPLKKKNK